jgi:hypothetical protein
VQDGAANMLMAAHGYHTLTGSFGGGGGSSSGQHTMAGGTGLSNDGNYNVDRLLNRSRAAFAVRCVSSRQLARCCFRLHLFLEGVAADQVPFRS